MKINKQAELAPRRMHNLIYISSGELNPMQFLIQQKMGLYNPIFYLFKQDIDITFCINLSMHSSFLSTKKSRLRLKADIV